MSAVTTFVCVPCTRGWQGAPDQTEDKCGRCGKPAQARGGYAMVQMEIVG